jgi:UTP-glucose-1-phosphate uridylyltransferase
VSFVDARTLVVMAAGAGSRFGGPKQTAPVGPNGEWLPEYAVFDAHRAGFDRVVFITRPELQDEFEDLGRRVGHSRLDIVHQRLDDIPPGVEVAVRDKPWGTGHAVLTVRNVVRSPFAIMNADDFYGADAYRLGAEACDRAARDGSATVVAMRLDATLSPHGPVKRGWCQANGDRVTRLEEIMGIARRPDGRIEAQGRHAGLTFTGSELVSMNFWVFPTTIFRLLSEKFEAFLQRDGRRPDAEFLLPDVVNELIAAGSLDLRAVVAPGPWFGLTYKEDLPEVTTGLASLTQQGIYPTPIRIGGAP